MAMGIGVSRQLPGVLENSSINGGGHFIAVSSRCMSLYIQPTTPEEKLAQDSGEATWSDTTLAGPWTDHGE